MAAITTRQTSAGGGDAGTITNNNGPLSNPQVDQNFINLNNELSTKAPLTGGGASGTWGINVTGTSAKLLTTDTRVIAPNSHGPAELRFGFTAWNNNNSDPYADYLHLRSYADGSGGNDNLITFRKDAIGMRIWQQTYGSGTAYSSYVDVLHSSNYNSYSPTLTGTGASGAWNITATGSGYYHSGRDFPNGTYIETNISVDTGEPWLLHITGNSYGASIPFDIRAQGYNYGPGTFYVGGAISNGTNIANISVFRNSGGFLCFWFAYQAYWQGFDVRCIVATGTYQTNRVTNIQNAAKPGSITLEAIFTPTQSLHSANYSNYALPLTGGTITNNLNIDGTLGFRRGSGDYSTYIKANGYPAQGYSNADGSKYWAEIGAAGGVHIVLNTDGAVNSVENSYDHFTVWQNSNTGTRLFHVTNSGNAVLSGSLTATNFADATGSYNVNLGSGGSEGRGLVAGYSGGWYGGIGYNVRHTAGSGVLTAPGGDTASYVLFNSGGFTFYGAAGGAAGRTLSFSTLASLSLSGDFNTLGAITQNNNQVLHAGNYNSYSPTLTGGGASGTWGISISGNAVSVSGLTITSSAGGINPDSVTQNQIGYNTSVNLFGQTDGGLYSSAHSSSWIHQIYGDFRTGQIAIRGKNNGTWQSWRTVLDSGNYNSYSPTLTGGGASGTWDISVTGNSATTSQRNFSSDISTSGQGRFTGWYTGNAATGIAAEIGMSGGQGYVFVYNRDNSTYGTLNIASSGANMQFSGSTINVSSGSLQHGGNQVLHAGNYSSYALPLSGGTVTGATYFNTSAGTTSGSLTNASLQAYSTGNNAAYMSFHRSGNYAVNMGLDSDNVLRIGGWSAPANRWQLDMSGNGTYAGNVTAVDFNSTSDLRLKENIVGLHGIELLADVNPVEFTWKNSGKKSYGVIAQELEQVLPELVCEGTDGMKSVHYIPLIAMLVDAVKTLDARVKELENK